MAVTSLHPSGRRKEPCVESQEEPFLPQIFSLILHLQGQTPCQLSCSPGANRTWRLKPRMRVRLSRSQISRQLGLCFSALPWGLDCVFGPHRHLTEDYKYQVLLDHLSFPSALQIANKYINSANPYTNAMQALTQRFRQPRQIVQSENYPTLLTCQSW